MDDTKYHVTLMLLTLSYIVSLLVAAAATTFINSRNELYEDHDALRNGPGVFNT
jgi:hypothetical protein